MSKLTTGKGEENQRIDEEELDDVDDHTSQRDLQRSQVRVDGEQVDQLEGTATNDIEEEIIMFIFNNTKNFVLFKLRIVL